MKLGVILGHTKKSQGAITYKGESEYSWNGKVIDHMILEAKKYVGLEIIKETRDVGGMTGAAQRLKAKGVNVCIELHFNSFSKAAFGCECLVLADDSQSAVHADLLTDALNLKYGFRERGVTKILGPTYQGDGVLEMKVGGRGYGNLKAVKDAGIAIRLLIEPTFMNKQTSESEKLINDQAGYAALLVHHFATFMNAKPIPDNDVTAEANLNDFVQALKEFNFSSNPVLKDLKPYLLAQFLLETGRGESLLFKKHFNAGGMKYRIDAVTNTYGPVHKISYTAHDGVDAYAGFDNYASFLEYYSRFILRSPYKGFEAEAKKGGKAFIEHLKKSGYATDPNYVSKVLGLVDEAEELLLIEKKLVVDQTQESFGWALVKALEELLIKIFKK